MRMIFKVIVSLFAKIIKIRPCNLELEHTKIGFFWLDTVCMHGCPHVC